MLYHFFSCSLSYYRLLFQLFEKIIAQRPDRKNPLFGLGVESMLILDFLEAVQERYPAFHFDWIEETSTLQDIVDWCESHFS